jgi:glycosyltransferase involved in cell wall biosynthesis
MQDTSDTNIGISIIICCYNSANRLFETLKHISNQIVSNQINWEVIIINNASKDNTLLVAQNLCKELLTNKINYSIYNELNPGLSNARKRGISEAKYEFLLFCDDDNWLNSNYTQLAYNTMVSDLSIGVLGGESVGIFETPPPEWFLVNQEKFALGKQNAYSGDVTYKKGYLWGAGFIVRKVVFDKLNKLGFEFFLSGRKGNSMSSGEDVELCFAVKSIGYKIFYSEDLTLKHYMPQGRFNYRSFLSLSNQNGKAAYVYDVYKGLVNNFIIYIFKNIFINIIKLLVVGPRMLFYKITKQNSKNKWDNDQRYFYYLGRLETLFNIKYCKNVLKKYQL